MTVQSQSYLLQVPGCQKLFKAVSHLDLSHRQSHVANLNPIATVKIPSGTIVDPARARRMSPKMAGGFRGNAI